MKILTYHYFYFYWIEYYHANTTTFSTNVSDIFRKKKFLKIIVYKCISNFENERICHIFIARTIVSSINVSLRNNLSII